ncbi:MAG: hypothetical protein GWN58_57040, partial [Anaerolineae bacterium]|nr:hypothetical protein [Anaerolineae bacterium]
MANTIVIFDAAKLALLNSSYNLSATMRATLMSTGWTPSIDASTVASLSTYFATKFSGGATSKQCPGPDQAVALVTKTADGVIKFDLSDIAFTASSGTNLSARYGLVYPSGGTIPVLYWEISSDEVVASQINVTWPS